MIFDRQKELNRLQKAYKSENSTFVAVDGRLHIGKTTLVTQCFNHRFSFFHTGLFKVSRADQIKAFCNTIEKSKKAKVIKGNNVYPTNRQETFCLLLEPLLN